MPKLPKGMFRRGQSYYWRRQVRGKDVWRSLGTDYDLACRRFRALRTEPSRMPIRVGDLCERWLDSFIATGRNAKNQRLARARAERYLKPFLGFLELERVRGEDLRAYRLWLEQQPISVATVKHVLGDVRCLLRWAVAEGYLDHSPVPPRLMPRLQERPPDRLTDDELARVLAIPEPHRFTVRFLVETGLRWGELVRARTDHVEQGMLVVAHTKTGRLRRVPIPAGLLDGRVGRLTPTTDAKAFAQFVRRHSGVQRFHVHQLRHTFACRWLERGGSLPALQQILGHTTIVTTQRYGRLSDRAVEAEARKLGQVVAEVVAGGQSHLVLTRPNALEINKAED